MPPTIDFAWAFAPPHRLTVCRPEASEKTLVDCYPDRLRLAWTYEELPVTGRARIEDDGRSVVVATPPERFSLRLTLRPPPGRTDPRTTGDTALPTP